MLPKSNAVSGSGRFWPVMFGPLYGRGRSSRAHWKRNSFRRLLCSVEMSEPLTACEWSFSIAFALRPQESTSNVPFSCSDQV